MSRETGGNMRLYEIETSWYCSLQKMRGALSGAFSRGNGFTAQEFIPFEDMALAVQPDQMVGASPDAVAKIFREARICTNIAGRTLLLQTSLG